MRHLTTVASVRLVHGVDFRRICGVLVIFLDPSAKTLDKDKLLLFSHNFLIEHS